MSHKFSKIGSSDDHQHHMYVMGAGLIIISILLVYTTVGMWMEQKKFPWGHETGVIIIFGIFISFLVSATSDQS